MKPLCNYCVFPIVKTISASNSRAPWTALLSIVMALVYDVSPIDLILDVIPLVGWLDDIGVSLVLTLFAIFSWRKWKKGRTKSNFPVSVH